MAICQSYDSWFFSPLNGYDRKEKRLFESTDELDADIDSFVAQTAIENIRLGDVPMIDWLIDDVFGGEDEFKRVIAEYLDRDDPIYKEYKAEYYEHNDPKIFSVD